MSNMEFYSELEDIHYKYERMESLIDILQMFVAEVVEVAGVSAKSLNNALFEVEIEMSKTNERLKDLILQKGGAALSGQISSDLGALSKGGSEEKEDVA